MMKLISIFIFYLFLLNSAGAQVNEMYVVAASSAPLRSGDNKKESVIATLSKNEVVQILKTNSNGWWYVDYNGTQGYIIAQLLKKRSDEGWILRKYQTDDIPTCENVNAQFDRNLENHLKIIVNSDSDVVIKLMQRRSEGDICIRSVYIENNDFTVLKNIPEGKYYLKIAYGKNWREKIVAGKCAGRFTENAQYEMGKQQLNFKIIQFDNRIDIPSYSLTLGTKINEEKDPTFTTDNISEIEFNN